MAPADLEQPDWKPPINRFLCYVQDQNCFHEIVKPGDSDDTPPKETRPFMPLDKIQEYFRARNYAELRAVLEALFPNDHHTPENIFHKYIAVFCTLLCIDKGQYINHFKHYDSLSDTSLPFNPANRPAHWPNTAEDSDFLRKFCQAQWKFCARIWEDLSDKHYESEQILPIILKKRLSGGGSANIWLVKIHPFYNRLISKDAKLLLGDAADTFVLKEYSTPDARVYYENETAAFNKVGSMRTVDHNIIKHYGSFTRGDTFNLLLEYADKGTLRRVFAEDSTPTGEADIIRFWEQIFKLMHSLHCIHTVKSPAPGAGGPQIFQGWHQDVKPENILVVSNGKQDPHEWHYKLADLGLSHFKDKRSLREDSTSSDTYGTRTYGAPECSRPDLFTSKSKLKVKQNIDIWSLGCVYSEIIRWLAQGKRGVLDYQEERKAEIRELDQAVGTTDCFHNGESVLDAVRKSHETSVARLHKTDLITDEVAHMVDEMLVNDNDRRDAQLLSRQQSRILEKAWKRLGEKINSLSPGHSFNSSEWTQTSRSQTHPTSSASPRIPPNLPPELTRNLHSPIRNHLQDNAASVSTDLGNGPNTLNSFLDDNRRLSSEPMAEYSSECGPLQLESPSNTSRLNSPVTPPSAQSPLFIADSSQVHSQESFKLPEHGSWNEGRRLPTRGKPQISELPSPSYNAANPCLTSTTGSLGHNSRHPPKASLLNGNSDYRRSTPAFDPQTNPLTGDFNTQQNAANMPQHYRNDSRQSRTSPTPNSFPPIGVHNSVPTRVIPQLQRPEPRSRKSRSAHEISVSTDMSIEEALKWRLECKASKTQANSINKDLRKDLEGRDHIFLIDDSNSMAEHWDDVVSVLKALSYIVKGTDKDGLDLFFRNSETYAEGSKETSKLINLVTTRKKTSRGPERDFDFRLNQILESRTEKLGVRGGPFNRKPKPMSLYILTDAAWGYDGYAQEPIKNAVGKLSVVNKSRKQIGIQFISFGNNPEALRRLEHLDNGLGLPSDIVDTEPADGNVWKMLLGAIDPAFDSQSPLSTPPGDIAGPSSFNTPGYGR